MRVSAPLSPGSQPEKKRERERMSRVTRRFSRGALGLSPGQIDILCRCIGARQGKGKKHALLASARRALNAYIYAPGYRTLDRVREREANRGLKDDGNFRGRIGSWAEIYAHPVGSVIFFPRRAEADKVLLLPSLLYDSGWFEGNFLSQAGWYIYIHP